MEFSFGIPSQRGKTSAKAMDLCPNLEALTICKNAGPRTAKLMVLNPLACEKLGIEDDGQIAFDFTRDQLTIINATGMSLPKGQGHSNYILTDTVNEDPVACTLILETNQESAVTLDVVQILDQVSLSSNGLDTAEEVSNFNNPN